MTPTVKAALDTITAALGAPPALAPVLEFPAPTPAENAEAVKIVYAAIDARFPATGTPGLPGGTTPGMYPAESAIADIYAIKDVTAEQIANAYCLVLSFAGGAAPFNAVRQQVFSSSHDTASGRILAFFAHPGGPPIEADQVMLPPAEFPRTFSEAEIQRRILLDPPIRYDGAPCGTQKGGVWRPIAEAAIAAATGKAWDQVPPATIKALGYSLWLKGGAYASAWTGNPADIAGLTAAQVFAKFDQDAVARGIQASA